MSVCIPIFDSRARRFHACSPFSTEHSRDAWEVRVRLSVLGELGNLLRRDLRAREQREYGSESSIE